MTSQSSARLNKNNKTNRSNSQDCRKHNTRKDIIYISRFYTTVLVKLKKWKRKLAEIVHVYTVS